MRYKTKYFQFIFTELQWYNNWRTLQLCAGCIPNVNYSIYGNIPAVRRAQGFQKRSFLSI